jgi:hypothetical protein
MTKIKAKWLQKGWGIRVGPYPGDLLQNLRFADDVLLLAKSIKVLKQMLEDLRAAAGEVGLELHMGKTNIFANSRGRKQSHAQHIGIGEDKVKILGQEASTIYLGRALAFTENHDREINHRIAAGWAKFTTYRKELCNRRLPLERRLKLFDAVVTPTVLYGSGSWTMTKEREGRLKVARRRMLRQITQVPRLKTCEEDGSLEDWVAYIIRSTHVAENESDKAGVSDWVLAQRSRKWRWAGHVARYEDRRWTKVLLDWMPTGARRSGRPTKRYEDELDEFATLHCEGARWYNAAKNRDVWRRLEGAFVNR